MQSPSAISSRPSYVTRETSGYAWLVELRYVILVFTAMLYIGLADATLAMTSHHPRLGDASMFFMFVIFPLIVAAVFTIAVPMGFATRYFNLYCEHAYNYGESWTRRGRMIEKCLIWRWNPFCAPFSSAIAVAKFLRTGHWHWARGIE